ncbi:unnamed protein product [Lathyrus sativus]|nr:unnamed protein product [Lathyrus sativus]
MEEAEEYLVLSGITMSSVNVSLFTLTITCETLLLLLLLLLKYLWASNMLSQDIGYSKLAHLAPQYGLYSSFVPPLIYAFMGSSRNIVIGPVAVVSLLMGTLLSNEIDLVAHKEEYQRLAFTATFFVGITQATLGIFRLGFLIDFLSHAAIVGFMGGAAITIGLQ